ncbi:class I SAM-dependent methyltransferase [Paraglaciecola aquimarina]|uniref:Class I SAM-dependent methyltransferase n=1 Tax=Paraglaciecola algarum TaxID=3050085 RepID=A0ABS9DEL1_9ALTE|nr:class I SAM-dependent methyltransferase [Paraglaciecola sp. G1-23]MCF2950482.1 class I SAM-dependent methyltransferase [Paraglaciecola sp. G1-23]
MKDLNNYYSHARTELAALVPSNTNNVVLELGCGGGATCAYIAREKKADEIWGIEKFTDAASHAKELKVLDHVLEGDAEVMIKTLPKEHFSHIIAGDILEHLVDPWTVCEDLKQNLKDGGVFICSIPNIRNLSFVLKLLFKKRFEYKDSGVLDRTHLRFFARKDVYQMFENAGYSNIKIGPVRPKKKLSYKLGKIIFGDLLTKGFLVTAQLKNSQNKEA